MPRELSAGIIQRILPLAPGAGDHDLERRMIGGVASAQAGLSLPAQPSCRICSIRGGAVWINPAIAGCVG